MAFRITDDPNYLQLAHGAWGAFGIANLTRLGQSPMVLPVQGRYLRAVRSFDLKECQGSL